MHSRITIEISLGDWFLHSPWELTQSSYRTNTCCSWSSDSLRFHDGCLLRHYCRRIVDDVRIKLGTDIINIDERTFIRYRSMVLIGDQKVCITSFGLDGRVLWRTCSAVGVLSGLSRPARICQIDDIIVSGLLKLMVSKKSSYQQWNCGETRPVSRLRTRLELHAFCGKGPRFIPSLDLGDHLWILSPAAKVLFNA